MILGFCKLIYRQGELDGTGKELKEEGTLKRNSKLFVMLCGFTYAIEGPAAQNVMVRLVITLFTYQFVLNVLKPVLRTPKRHISEVLRVVSHNRSEGRMMSGFAGFDVVIEPQNESPLLSRV